MPFLTLNGVTIPTAKGGEIKITEYGERTAGFDGSAQIDVRSRKREWQFNTKPISMVRSRAIEGLVQGNGLYLPFDFYGGSNTSYYASNGLYPTQVTGTTAVYAQAYDGFTSLDENGVIGALVGTSSLSFDLASTNLAAVATATCSSTTNWTSSNATLTVDTTHFWDGSNSIKVVQTTGSTFTYANSPVIAVTSPANYTLSLYVYSAAACSFNIGAAYGTASGAPGSYSSLATVNHPGGCWKRFTCSAVVSGSNTAVGVSLTIPAANGSVGPLWIDAIQVEASTSGSNNSPTSWQPGTASRSNANLIYPFNYYNPTGVTFSAWIAGNPASTAGACELFSVFDSSSNRIFYAESFTGVLNNYVTTSSGTYGKQVTLTQPLTSWTHVVVTYYGNPFTSPSGTTYPNLNVYVNGVLTGSIVAPGVLNTPATINIGSVYGNAQFLGRMDDVQVLPYGVDAKWVSQTYAASSGAAVGAYGQTGLAPFLTAAGDGIDGAPVTVHGSIKQANYVGFQDPQFGWIPQGRSLQILLTEV